MVEGGGVGVEGGGVGRVVWGWRGNGGGGWYGRWREVGYGWQLHALVKPLTT